MSDDGAPVLVDVANDDDTEVKIPPRLRAEFEDEYEFRIVSFLQLIDATFFSLSYLFWINVNYISFTFRLPTSS